MRAITVPAPGGPDAMVWAEVSDPAPGRGEVLIEVAAAGVNRADLSQREGNYPPPAGASQILGMECSGRIAALGPDVTGFAVGEQVCALLAGGGYAELAVAPVGQLLPIPAGVSVEDAAAVPEVAGTVWSTVFMLARLQPGEVLLVHGGSSGIGTAAIQLAVRHGARVICTAGSEAKREHCLAMGAELAIDYRNDDFVAAVKKATDRRGADVILDIVGAAYLGQNVDTLATGGRLVVIGLQGGRRGELDLGALLTKRGTILSAGLRGRSVENKAEIIAAVHENVWPAIESGAVRIVVDRRLPMDQAADAHRAMAASEHIGKIVLTRPGA